MPSNEEIYDSIIALAQSTGDLKAVKNDIHAINCKIATLESGSKLAPIE